MKKYTYLKNQDKLSTQIIITIWITVCVLLTLFPVFITIVNSLKSDIAIRASIFTFPTAGKGFFKTIGENYVLAWKGTEYVAGMSVYFWRSVALAFIGAALTCVIGTFYK